jgi:Fur family peroxide stress response transcriptional regulator
MTTDNPGRVDEAVAKLKAAGYRITTQRVAVIEALISSDEHPSAEMLYHQVRRQFPTTSIATVYNTLECLKQLGEVLELPRSGGKRYDGRNLRPHSHLICTLCNRIEDVDIDQLGLETVAKGRGYRELNYYLELSGVCPQCQKLVKE